MTTREAPPKGLKLPVRAHPPAGSIVSSAPAFTRTRVLGVDLGRSAVRRLRNRSVTNLLRMGHCAPTVMQTMLDASGTETCWLVKLTAGLPGGIGNTGGECGAVTSLLILLGLRRGRRAMRDGLPTVVDEGHELIRRFTNRNGTIFCRDIRGHARLPLRCIGVVRQSPELCAQTLSTDCAGAIPRESREAYRRLCAPCEAVGFHCAHAVFQNLRSTIPVTEELLDGTSAFMGGTVFMGLTCSAFTAGVMAIGVALGEIEDSRLRVLRMIGIMAAGGNAFADDLNAFNRVMNLGHRLSAWFTAEFGSTQCRAITKCDFSTASGVTRYVDGGGVARCEAIARQVASRVEGIIERARGGLRVARDEM